MKLAFCTTKANLLSIRDIMARYRLKDPRAARRIARDVGYVRIGGKMFVPADELDAWQQNSICREDRSTIGNVNTTVVAVNQQNAAAPLEEEWWLDG